MNQGGQGEVGTGDCSDCFGRFFYIENITR